jgi:high potential iron-sulfur protein
MRATSPPRRRLLRRLALGLSLLPLGGAVRPARAAPLPLLSVDAPEAKAVSYVEDARQAHGAAAGSRCANCALYQGADGSARGPCQLFPGKDVQAAGWCSSWAAQL